MSTARLRVCSTCLLAVAAVVFVSGQEPKPQRPIDRVTIGKAPATGTTQKIVGGKPAQPGKYPFQVALISAKTPVGQEHFGQFCGGALIDKSWVVTAAHCVPRTSGDEVDVYIGSNVLPAGRGNAGGRAGKRLSVRTEIFSHQKYDPDTNDNDIALLHLKTDAPAEFAPVPLATAEIDTAKGAVGRTVTVIGWGATREGGDTTPKLREVDVQIQDSAACLANYKDVVPSSKITPNMFCAGRPQGGADSCQGDSGGFIGAAADGSTPAKPKFVQLGIVSWGIGCARPKLFGVYTRIANYQAWIQEVMKGS